MTIHVCPFNCGYTTNRVWSMQYHLNRKIPCYNLTDNNNEDDRLESNESHKQIRTNSTTTAARTIICPKCKMVFQNRQAKYRHVKKNDCSHVSIVENETAQDEIKKLQLKVKQLESKEPSIINNTYITDNSQINNTAVNTVNNCITYHNYDEPNVDHIDAQVIKKLYFDNGRHLKKMVNEAVRRIYKKPENNTFRFPQGIKSNFVEVRYRDEKRLLPMKEVIETVLTKTSLVCEEHLRDHYYGGTIVGSAVLTHANHLEDLALQPWDDDKANRADFHPYVKSALMECI